MADNSPISGADHIPPGAAPILVALGANLPSDRYGSPRQTLEAALVELERRGVRVLRRSRWYESAPVPRSDQPWYVNGVAAVETSLDPDALLALLHRVEAEFGRIRGVRNAPRLIDLDLIAYGDEIRSGPEGPVLPHPRAAERAFVLLPLAEIAPGWRLPGDGRTVEALIAGLPPDQEIRPVAPEVEGGGQG